MPHLLVTGGAGFIGSHIVEAAVARGWDVTVVDSLRADVHPPTGLDLEVAPIGDLRGRKLLLRPRNDSRSRPLEFESPTSYRRELLAAQTLGRGARFIEADLTDDGVADAVIAGMDAVCHQAAKVGLGVDFDDAPDYAHPNVTATALVLAAMGRHGVDRLTLASSMVVYGEGLYTDGVRTLQPPVRAIADLQQGRFEPTGPDGAPLRPILIDEDDTLDPRNVYAATKLAQEQLASAWARSTGGRVAALRYHNVFGARMPMGTPYAGVASLFRTELERGRAPRVFEDGAQRRDFVEVRDVASANIAALDWTTAAPNGSFRAFNIGSGVIHTVGEFATALANALDGPQPIVTGEYRLGDVRHITASSERALRELNWRPTHEFRSAVAEFAGAPLRAPRSANTPTVL